MCFDAACSARARSAATSPGEPLPPGGREPPEAQKLALLRELMTFITWCARSREEHDTSACASACFRACCMLLLLLTRIVCPAAPHRRSRHENLVQLFGWCANAPLRKHGCSADCAADDAVPVHVFTSVPVRVFSLGMCPLKATTCAWSWSCCRRRWRAAETRHAHTHSTRAATDVLTSPSLFLMRCSGGPSLRGDGCRERAGVPARPRPGAPRREARRAHGGHEAAQPFVAGLFGSALTRRCFSVTLQKM